MKITFILPTFDLSGGTRVASLHAAMLGDRGHDVELISLPQKKATLRQKLRALKNGNISQLISHGTLSCLDDLDVNHRVLDTHRAITNDDVPDADVIIATWWETAEWVAALAPNKGAKVYFIQDHEIFDNLPVERAKATYKSPLHKIVVSEWLHDLMKGEYGDDNNDLVLNSVDFNKFIYTDRKKSLRTTVGFLYTQAPRKAVDLAIDCLIKAREINPGLRVLSFGSQKPDKRLPLPSWVEFQHQPSQDRIPGIYASCDAWLFTSHTEGFGLPIIEAMACGTPVIGTSAGAAPQYINNQTGVLVESTPEAFVEQIIRFSEMNEEEWLQKSTNARQRVSGYTWHDASLLFENALFNAINKPPLS